MRIFAKFRHVLFVAGRLSLWVVGVFLVPFLYLSCVNWRCLFSSIWFEISEPWSGFVDFLTAPFFRRFWKPDQD